MDYLIVENAEGTVTVHNTAGKLVKRFRVTGDKQRMNLSTLPKGNYVLRFQTVNGQTFTKQVIK